MSGLARQPCLTINKNSAPLDELQINDLAKEIPGWNIKDNQQIQKTFAFNDYNQTISFVNAVAKIAQQNNHHPDMHIGYNTCIVTYTTHTINGLTINDFICAAKIDQLLSHS